MPAILAAAKRWLRSHKEDLAEGLVVAAAKGSGGVVQELLQLPWVVWDASNLKTAAAAAVSKRHWGILLWLLNVLSACWRKDHLQWAESAATEQEVWVIVERLQELPG